jgi:hypothetical protein
MQDLASKFKCLENFSIHHSGLHDILLVSFTTGIGASLKYPSLVDTNETVIPLASEDLQQIQRHCPILKNFVLHWNDDAEDVSHHPLFLNLVSIL